MPVKEEYAQLLVLSTKSYKQIIRSTSYFKSLLFIASFILFQLYLLWYKSGDIFSGENSGRTGAFIQLNCSTNFDKCSTLPDERNSEFGSKYFLADTLMHYIKTGYFGTDEESNENLKSTVTYLTANGFPLLDMDDFISLGDLLKNRWPTITIPEESKEPMDQFLQQVSFLKDIRSYSIILAPRNCWTEGFISYMQSQSNYFNELNYIVTDDKNSAISLCCDNIWAIIYMDDPYDIPSDIITSCEYSEYTGFTIGPKVTIHMNSSSIPDTRYFTTRTHESKHPLHATHTKDEDHIQYYLSGFLTLQLEIQNFLYSLGYGGHLIRTSVFDDNGGLNITDVSTRSDNNNNYIIDEYRNLQSKHSSVSSHRTAHEQDCMDGKYDEYGRTIDGISRPPSGAELHSSVWLSPMPNHTQSQSAFWTIISNILIILLLILFSCPGIIASGIMMQEEKGGQQGLLLTIGALPLYCLLGWCLAACYIIIIQGILTFLLMGLFMGFNASFHISILLSAFGVASIPFSFLIVGVFDRPGEIAVVVVLLGTLSSALPAYLYSALAFDIQRLVSTGE